MTRMMIFGPCKIFVNGAYMLIPVLMPVISHLHIPFLINLGYIMTRGGINTHNELPTISQFESMLNDNRRNDGY